MSVTFLTENDKRFEVSIIESGTSYIASHCVSSIIEAVNNNRTVVCLYNDYELPLISVTLQKAIFQCMDGRQYVRIEVGSKAIHVFIDDHDCLLLTDGDKVLHYNKQLLTKDEQTQARENIGLYEIEPAADDIPSVFFNGTNPVTKDEYLCEMDYVSKTERFHAYVKIKAQGTSSLVYPKKNYTIKMYSDSGYENKLKKNFKGWGKQNKFCLKANYIDHTHARNIVCAKLWTETVKSRPDFNTLPIEMRESPCVGAIDGFPIRVYYNGIYQGVYTWNIPKDAWQWNMDDENPNHVLMCAETNDSNANSANFKALWDGTDGEEWSIEVGTYSEALKQSMNNLIACVKDTDDETFKVLIGNYLDIQSAIDYYIHFNMITGADNVAKNMLMATYNGTKWILGAYDMDATYGAQWDGKLIYTHSNDTGAWGVRLNKLWERITALYATEIKERYAELRETVYSDANVIAKFEEFTSLIGTELYAEDVEIFPNIPEPNTSNIKQLRTNAHERGWFTDRKFESPLYPLASGVKEFSDFYKLTIEDGYQITVECTDVDNASSTTPNMNISSISTNKDTCTSSNNIDWNKEMFVINDGDVVRVVAESKNVIECPIKLVSKDGTKKIQVNPTGWHGLRQYDHTYVMKEGEGMIVGTISISPKQKQTVSFKLKIYVNGVRYV